MGRLVSVVISYLISHVVSHHILYCSINLPHSDRRGWNWPRHRTPCTHESRHKCAGTLRTELRLPRGSLTTSRRWPAAALRGCSGPHSPPWLKYCSPRVGRVGFTNAAARARVLLSERARAGPVRFASRARRPVFGRALLKRTKHIFFSGVHLSLE